LLAGVLALMAVSPASAQKVGADDLKQFQLRTKTFEVGSEEANGGYVRCPDGSRVVTGGAFWDAGGAGPDPSEEDVRITGSSANFAADRWFGSGTNVGTGTMDLVVAAQCLPQSNSKKIGAGDLRRYQTESKAFSIPTFQAGGGYVGCREGSRVITGGAFPSGAVTSPNPSREDLYLTGSSATFTADGWYGAGLAVVPGAGDLVVWAQCLPTSSSRKVGSNDLKLYELRTQTFVVGPDQAGGGYVSCPAGSRVVTGGAFWDSGGMGPDPLDDQVRLTGSSATFAADGWYGAGANLSGVSRDLIVAALCLPR
jgi:hypothetical protein